MAKREGISWAIKALCLGAIDIAIGIPKFFILTFAFSYEIGTFLVAGLSWVIARSVFLTLIPFILKHSDTFLDILNGVIVYMQIFLEIDIMIIDAIIGVSKAITDIINAVSKFFSGHKVTNGLAVNFMHLFKIETVSRAGFKNFLIGIQTNCPAYDSAGSIFDYITKSVLGPALCAPVRFLYPAEPIYKASEAVIGWTYYGTADPTPGIPDTNCADVNTDTADYVCVALGAGYIILEIFLPLIFLLLFVVTLGRGISWIFRFTVWLVVHVAEYVGDLSSIVIKILKL